MIAPTAGAHVLETYRVGIGMVLAAHPVSAVPSAETELVDVQQALRLAAIDADATATSNLSLSLLWRRLARGTSRIVDGFFTGNRCYLVLALSTGEEAATPAQVRRMEILEAVLGGVRQKNIAIDLKLAPSTVAMNARLALASLGADCKPSRAHPILILAARAVNGPAVAFATSSLFVDRDDRELRVISLPRPEQCLTAMLPAAELEVVRSLVEGLSHEEIAQRRKTSSRTVANQIGSVFRRLSVSGRNELIQRLLFDRSVSGHEPMAPETIRPAPISEPTPVAAVRSTLRSA